MSRTISGESEFLSLMEEIDTQLMAEQIPTVARPLHALRKVAMTLRTSIDLPQPGAVPREGVYHGDDLSAHVLRWFDMRYGDSLLTDFRLGRICICIRQTFWELVIPRAYGSFNYICSGTSGAGPHEINITDHLSSMTEPMKRSLTRAECDRIFVAFRPALSLFIRSCGFQGNDMVTEAIKDIDATVHHLLVEPPNLGQAHWSSSQASEKFIKAYMQEMNMPVPKIHGISKLAALAFSNNVQPFEQEWISSSECSPSVRYGPYNGDVTSAYRAHYASLEIGNMMLGAIVVQRKRGSHATCP